MAENNNYKLLLISDSIEMKTGVGIQARHILFYLNSVGRQIVHGAGAINHQHYNTYMFNNIKMYPIASYGDAGVLRRMLEAEKPDFLMLFSDPRFFYYAFNIENEIRQYCPIVYYHLWDDQELFPDFNKPFYDGCDYIITASKSTYRLMRNNYEPKDKIYYIPHCIDESDFYPLNDEDEKLRLRVQHLGHIYNKEQLKDMFIIFNNNRNITRKRLPDMLRIFNDFRKTHKNSLMILHTNPDDFEGGPLLYLREQLMDDPTTVMISVSQSQPESYMNMLYNICDVNINITYAEGFGLSTSEASMTGTPTIATETGGLIDQIRDAKKGETHGWLLPASTQNIATTKVVPYVHCYMVSDESVLNALIEAYDMKKSGELKKLGERVREYGLKNFSSSAVLPKWDKFFLEKLKEKNKELEHRQSLIVGGKEQIVTRQSNLTISQV